MTLELVHIGGTKETVEVLGIDSVRIPRLLFRWGVPPVQYSLDVVRNRVQRAHEWRASDPQAARDMWNQLVRDRRVNGNARS